MNPLTNLPAGLRQAIYTALAFIVLIEGALAVAFTTQPNWLLTATRVTAYVSGIVGVTAAVNVRKRAKRRADGFAVGPPSPEVMSVSPKSSDSTNG